MNMVKVYELSVELARDPEYVARAQALTLNLDKPFLGLRGNLGLFGSTDWWENIRTGIMPTTRIVGVIQRVYVAGMERSDVPNAFDMTTSDGQNYAEGVYANSPQDITRFRVGATVDFLYALDEMKAKLRDGTTDYCKVVLEMSVSA